MSEPRIPGADSYAVGLSRGEASKTAELGVLLLYMTVT